MNLLQTENKKIKVENKMTDDELIEFYESNGVKIRNSDGTYCKLYFEQVVSSGYYWDNDKNLWLWLDIDL